MEVAMFASRSDINSGNGSRPAPKRLTSRMRGRVAVLALTALLPAGAALSQSEMAAKASIPTTICGTWSMLQVSKLSALTFYRPQIDASLKIPGVKGFSLRAPWSAIATNLSIFDTGVAIAAADHSALALRFISGVDTPSQFLGNSTTIGSQRIPLPWGPGTTTTKFVPNTVFENAYKAVVLQLAAYARLHGIHLLHLPWYSGTTAEVYNGPEVQRAPGYSITNFLTGYERLIAIGMSVTSSSLSIEFPLGGVGTGNVAQPLEAYIVAHYGSMNPAIMVQFNDLTSAVPGAQHPATGVNMSRQMQGQGDFNWTNVYLDLKTQHSQAVEIYMQSFAPNLAHYATLRSQVAAFAPTC
jgi:hypothetical protein